MKMNHKPSILGISGVARSGKDTFYSFISSRIGARRLAFADALKDECREFLVKNIGIYPFTNDPKEKEVIRPFLVTYGTHLRRKLDSSCWIKKIEEDARSYIKDEVLPVVTDVRYRNEADWIHSLGGKLIHISRTISLDGQPTLLPPSNNEEEESDPLLMECADQLINWDTFEDIEECRSIVKQCLKNLQITN